MLVWDRWEEEWSFRGRVAWKMGSSKSTWPHWAGGRWWLQCPSHGHVDTTKAPVKDYSMISMGWREGIGKSLGQNARRIWFGSQLGLSRIKTFVPIALYVVWDLWQKVGGRAECRHHWFLPHLPHAYHSFLPRLGEHNPGLSLTLLTLWCFPSFIPPPRSLACCLSRFSVLFYCYTSILSFLKSCV